jgi:hypothetical protein
VLSYLGALIFFTIAASRIGFCNSLGSCIGLFVIIVIFTSPVPIMAIGFIRAKNKREDDNTITIDGIRIFKGFSPKEEILLSQIISASLKRRPTMNFNFQINNRRHRPWRVNQNIQQWEPAIEVLYKTQSGENILELAPPYNGKTTNITKSDLQTILSASTIAKDTLLLAFLSGNSVSLADLPTSTHYEKSTPAFAKHFPAPVENIPITLTDPVALIHPGTYSKYPKYTPPAI